MRCSRTKAPSLCRHYPTSQVIWTSSRPCRPDLTLAGCRLARATPPDRASRVASIPLFHAYCRHYPGGICRCLRRSLPDRWQPSPFPWRVGFRITRFGACSAFAHAAVRIVAKPPSAARCAGVLQTMSLPPSSAPTATGWSDSCRAGFAPAEEWRLFTAHTENRVKAATDPVGCYAGAAIGLAQLAREARRRAVRGHWGVCGPRVTVGPRLPDRRRSRRETTP